VFLTDGSVLDRLAIETVWNRYQTVLVSDGTSQLASIVEEPPTDWARQSLRVLELIDWQARSAQKRQLIASFTSAARRGTYWGIGSFISAYGLPTALPCPDERTKELSALPSRLRALDEGLQQRLINWGYAICDAAIRKHHLPDAPPPTTFPYPSAAV
jgi:NTE family protein